MKYAIRFRFPSGEETVYYSEPGLNLLDASRKAGLDLDAPCSGNGICRKCTVRILASDGDEDWRLACRTEVKDGMVVLIPEKLRTSTSKMKIADLGDRQTQSAFNSIKNELRAKGFAGDSGIETVPLVLEKPAADDPTADCERLLDALKKILPESGSHPESRILPESKIPEAEKAAPEISLHALRKLPAVLREGNFSCTCVISRSKYGISVLDIFPNQIKKLPVPGLAIDIGTTTVAAILTDLNSTEILASGSRGNPQIRYGADVINRIIESTRPSGLERLRRILLDECIVPLVMELSVKAGISSTQIYRTAIAANTTMTHLFTGITPEYLRLEPYVPAFFRAKGLRAADLDLPIHPDAEVLIAPSVGSYVGGDISAGLFASMICSRDKYSLFIDLGTNGELVFGGREFLMTCACSAGPAFEGGDISCGMRAADGAIDSVSIDRETLEPDFTVIGNRMPAGICGSGLIDLVGELFEKQCIDPRGKFIGEAKPDGSGRSRIQRDEYGMASYIVAFADSTENQKDIYISEGDIDNFIRAKGAIFSAVRTMLAMLGFSIDDINEVYIAGGIGSGINVQKAIRIGMLPDIPAERYHYLGNTSLTGAWAMVQSQKAVQEIDKTADKMTYLELSSHPSYMDEFIAACFLPHTDSRLFGK